MTGNRTTAAPTANHCPAYLLSGGKSTRFGSDKALVEIHAQPQLLGLWHVLHNQGHEVHVVADRDDRYQHIGLSCLVDEMPGCGPLAALATALRHRRQESDGWLLLLNCDQAMWQATWFQQLAEHATADIQMVTFVETIADGQKVVQPLPGLFHTRLLPTVLQQLQSGQFAMQHLVRNAPAATVDTVDNPRRWSFNTMHELQQIQTRLR